MGGHSENQFCIAFNVFQVVIVILTLRFVFHDSLSRKAETFSGIAFWFITGFFLQMLTSETLGWFGYVAGLIIAIGVAITASNIFKLLG
jgi:hypothetical protein